jgi:hypothetical protein
MSYRLRLKVRDEPEEYKVLVSFFGTNAVKVIFEERGYEKSFFNSKDAIEFLAQFCFSGCV